MAIKHEVFKNKISKDAYQFLVWLHSKALHEIEMSLFEQIKNIPEIKEVFPHALTDEDSQLKIKTLYLRYCHLIEYLIAEYQELENDEKQQMIDYYVFNNSLKELNFLGMGFYYDCKYKQTTATLYKGRSKQVNWKQKASDETRKNKVSTDAVKEMFKACRQHINIGGDIELKSYSKCFILDLFKYISLYEHPDGHFLADVYVKEKADINIIQVHDQTISIQKYILADYRLQNIEFVIDFSEPRNYDRDNFYRWYESFMETEFKKESSETPSISEYKNFEEYFQYYFANNLNQSENRTQVSLMVSPVSDREVVLSGDLWETIDFETYENQRDACIHFSFTEEELFELIIAYFVTFFNMFNRNEEADLDQAFRNDVLAILDKLQEIINKNSETEVPNNTIGEIDITKKIDAIKHIVAVESTNKKVLGLLEMIDWDYEKKYWSDRNVDKFVFKKIYNKNAENIFVNVLKCVCIDAVRGKHFGI